MVAYAYAAQFPSETEKLVVMDAFLPGVAGWEGGYNDPQNWDFSFNGPAPEGRDGRTSTTTLTSGISASMARRRKRWCADASGFILTTSGTTLPPTRRV